jgi:hypothetical protein
MPFQAAPRLGGVDLGELPVYQVFALSLAHLLAGPTAVRFSSANSAFRTRLLYCFSLF